MHINNHMNKIELEVAVFCHLDIFEVFLQYYRNKWKCNITGKENIDFRLVHCQGCICGIKHLSCPLHVKTVEEVDVQTFASL